MEKGGKELKVSAIKNGTVLDHIPANQLFKVISILGLKDCANQITFGTNLDSKLLGKKAIIKDFEVVEKKVLRVPDEITGIVKCANPKCVTNHEPITTKFSTEYENGVLKLHCHYCEKNTGSDNLKIITEN